MSIIRLRECQLIHAISDFHISANLLFLRRLPLKKFNNVTCLPNQILRNIIMAHHEIHERVGEKPAMIAHIEHE